MNRLITAIGLLAVAFYLIFFAPEPVFFIAALAMGLLCYREYALLVVAHRIPHPGWVGIAGGLFILLWPELTNPRMTPVLGLVLLVLIAFVVALRFSALSEILPYVSCAILGASYTFAPWRFAIDLRKHSVHLLFFALALNWIGDTAAYYVGRAWGKRRLAPIVSPNKSWEGAAASVVASIIFGLLYLGHFLPSLPWWQILLLASIGNVAGQFGDLAESAVKRGAGVKDSGYLLPGHGGILDRVDSSLFALPVVLAIYTIIQ
jgi:phosphatidate cytidylyltransferase